jgi:endo-1,3(4)-beta-glucanase
MAGVPLLGGEPLAISAAPWPARDHALKPTDRWGMLTRPYPTNAWWQNLVLGQAVDPVNVLPYLVKTLSDGLHLCLPERVVGATSVLSMYQDNLVLGALAPLSDRALTAHDELSVTMSWQAGNGTSLSAPLVRGMPYASVMYDGLRPRVATPHAITSVNGQAPGVTVDGTRFVVGLNNGQTWHVYASETLSFATSASELVAAAPLDGWLRAAVVTPQTAPLLDAHASRIPLGASVTATASGDMADLVFEWKASGAGELLMMALPHHADQLVAAKWAALEQLTIKGTMKAVIGDVWQLREDLTTIQWNAPGGVPPHRVAALKQALSQDMAKTVVASDPYFGGKQLAALARLVLIADELGEDALRDHYRNVLAQQLEPWLAGSNALPLVYDQTWGGVVSSAGITDPGAAFGQGYYNDHHFHYGYFIYAAAVLAKIDPQWRATWGDAVMHLVRDIAEPSGADPLYTYLRNKDWFVGHSWAAGLFAFGDSRNQESSSEAVNAWYAVYLYGLASGDERLRDVGRLLLATELRSTWRYWQMMAGGDIYPPPFADNKVVGVLWSTKVDYATFFGNNIEYIHGIQMLPFTPISESLLRPGWIAESYPVVSAAFNDPNLSQAWRGFLIMAHGIIDAEAAWTDAQALNAYDDGNSKTNTLYWLATRPR